MDNELEIKFSYKKKEIDSSVFFISALCLDKNNNIIGDKKDKFGVKKGCLWLPEDREKPLKEFIDFLSDEIEETSFMLKLDKVPKEINNIKFYIYIYNTEGFEKSSFDILEQIKITIIEKLNYEKICSTIFSEFIDLQNTEGTAMEILNLDFSDGYGKVLNNLKLSNNIIGNKLNGFESILDIYKKQGDK